MTSNHSSSPIKNGHPPSQKASDVENTLKNMRAVSLVPYAEFSANYLPAKLEHPEFGSWTPEQQALVDNIRDIGDGNEVKLYTKSAPLLRLCNTVSKQILDSCPNPPETALVFYSHHRKGLSHPFFGLSLSPDIIVLHENPAELESPLDIPLECPNNQNWSTIAAVGEAKVTKDPTYQTANYLLNHLQLRPDLHSVLGFSVKASGYSLFYHDASVIHQSEELGWTPGPLHAFVRQLYQGTSFDPSIVNLRPMDPRPSWAIRIDSDIFVTISAKPDQGLGQRRFIAEAKHVVTKESWFIKDFYRDDRRRFFEGALYDKAHKGTVLPGLMYADHHGCPLDKDGRVFKTSKCGQGPYDRAPVERTKMRVATRDVGKALSETKTLGEFLHIMYDACVVQRNLYRKCKILHRDISDNNIMIAPKDERFLERCSHGYDEVKYLNQILAPNERPKPACLIIDLGNGADLDAANEDSGVLAERTGTPKFISRSVSKGRLLSRMGYRVDGVTMPKLSGRSLQLCTSNGNSEYEKYNRAANPTTSPDRPVTPDFAHRLFHDAESTFWVMTWFLARSAPKGYKPETDRSSEFKRFISGMESHYPSSDGHDLRFGFGPEDWKGIIHPGLSSMAPMLCGMHTYIYPEWGRSPELEAEHVHEALMRLLLTEIVRIRDENADVEFHTGTRALPTNSKPTPSLSNSRTTASSLNVPTGSKKRSRSQGDDDAGSGSNPRPSPRLAQLQLRDTEDDAQVDRKRAAIEELLRQAQKHSWVQMPKYLDRTNYRPPAN